jgi:hypothetical protein
MSIYVSIQCHTDLTCSDILQKHISNLVVLLPKGISSLSSGNSQFRPEGFSELLVIVVERKAVN